MISGSNIDLNTLIVRNDKRYLASKLGEELVMMDLELGNFVLLNQVGAEIWGLSESPIAVVDLIDKLSSIYNVTYEICEQETIQFLKTPAVQSIFTFSNISSL